MIWSKPLILLLLLLLIALKEEIKFRRAAQEKYESFWDDAGVMANLKMHDMSDKENYLQPCKIRWSKQMWNSEAARK